MNLMALKIAGAILVGLATVASAVLAGVHYLGQRDRDREEKRIEIENCLNEAWSLLADGPGPIAHVVDTTNPPILSQEERVRLDKAKQAIQKALVLDEENAKALTYLGIYHSRLHETEDAKRLLLTAIDSDPSYFRAHRSLGVLYLSMGEPVRALEAFRQAADLPGGGATDFANIGVALRRMKRHDDAIEWLKRAVATSPMFADGWKTLGVAHHQLGHLEDAAIAYRRAIALTEAEPDPLILYNLADVLRTLAYRSVELVPQEICRRTPPPELSTSAELQEAIQLFRTVLTLTTPFPEVSREVSLLLALSESDTGRHREALTVLQEIAGDESQFHKFRLIRGIVLFRMGEYRDARVELEAMAESNPYDATAWRCLTTILTAQLQPASE